MFQRLRDEKPEMFKKLHAFQGDVTFDGKFYDFWNEFLERHKYIYLWLGIYEESHYVKNRKNEF